MSGSRFSLATRSILFSKSGVFEGQSVSSCQSAGGVDHHGQEVNPFQRLSHLGHHLASQQVARTMNSRRIDQYDLCIRAIDDSENAVSRRLRPRGHNGHLLAHEPVYERGLPGIRPPKYRDETGTKFFFHMSITKDIAHHITSSRSANGPAVAMACGFQLA
jgi:hypothetical protein